ncbi:MAG: tetratricopeptide repeat protein [Patescibacteria group bacterium]
MTDTELQAQAAHAQGLAYLEKGMFGEALFHLKKAITLVPNYLEAHNTLGRAYNETGDFELSIQTCLHILSQNPQAYFVLQNIAKSYGEMGRHAEALSYYYRYIALSPTAATAYSDLFLTLNYLPMSREAMFVEHYKFHIFDKNNTNSNYLYQKNIHDSSKRKIKVGYVSGDLREHPVAHLFVPVIKNHDRSKFNIHIYNNTHSQDDVTKKIKNYGDTWRDIQALSHEDTLELIRSDNLDILVDLSGHTGSNRLLIFAARAAPIQVAWLGYMNTTGLKNMDYRITDFNLSVPDSEKYYTEKLWRVTNSFTFDPLMELPDIDDLPALKNGFITFASLNNYKKITSHVYDVWADILRKIPTSRLVFSLKGNDTLKQSVLTKFELRGISSDRIKIIDQKLIEDYVKFFNDIDILLDPFPFTGCITVFHGLWGGVPSIVMEGVTEYERNGPTVMKKVGLDSCIAHNPQEYVDIAVYWASHFDELAELRKKMREKFPKNEDKLVTKGIEDAFIKMYNR